MVDANKYLLVLSGKKPVQFDIYAKKLR